MNKYEEKATWGLQERQINILGFEKQPRDVNASCQT